MNATVVHRLALVGRASVMLIASLASASAGAAGTPIYKCFDKQLGVLYTDVPCKDGEEVDIRAGDADPAALARLQRELDALDRSVERRVAEDRRTALQRQYAAQFAYLPETEPVAYPDEATYAPSGYGFVPYYGYDRARPKALRPSKRFEPQSAVPASLRAASRMPPR